MKSKNMRIAVYAATAGLILLTALVYPMLPARIPMNWSMSGQITYNSKRNLWFMAGLGLVLALSLDFMPRIDPRKRNYAKFHAYYDLFCLMMEIFMYFMWGIVVIESLRPGTVSVGKTVTVFLGILFVFLGNMLPKVENNYFMGIKNPWTWSDDGVWRRTHRLAGKLFFIGGILSVITAVCADGKILGVVFFSIIMICCLVPTVMSYVWWRGAKEQEPPSGA